MAKNVKINSITYNGVPQIQVPLATGSGNATFYETSDATVDAATLLAGTTAYGAAGKVTGTLTAATISQDGTTKVLTIS